MIKYINRKNYLYDIFLKEVCHFEEAVLLGEIELARAEEAIKDRKENLLSMRQHLQLARAELEKVKNEG